MSQAPIEKVLVLGSGGREAALVWHLRKTGYDVDCAPGSDSIARLANCWEFKNFDELLAQIKSRKIDRVIVGPEKYLDEGVADFLQSQNIPVFGPNKKAAQLETDKAYSKEFCLKYRVPTARSKTITREEEISEALESFSPPFVVKAAGLAAGKGVWIGSDVKEATEFAKTSLKHHASVLIEEFLAGEEISYFVMIDETQNLFLGAAQDHKRLLENDAGPNTGGMGAYTPLPQLTDELQTRIHRKVILPILNGLQAEELHYSGFLFVGLMIVGGEPFVLEFNCRLGDPETQALLLRLNTPLPTLIDSLKNRSPLSPEFLDGTSLTVVVAAEGYPGEPAKGFELAHLEKVPNGVEVFHSGTKWNGSHWTANGGRIFSVNTLQPSLIECQNTIYPWLESLPFVKKIKFRRDIGMKAYRYLRPSDEAERQKSNA